MAMAGQGVPHFHKTLGGQDLLRSVPTAASAPGAGAAASHGNQGRAGSIPTKSLQRPFEHRAFALTCASSSSFPVNRPCPRLEAVLHRR